MPITTADFSSLTDDLQEVFNEAASVGIAESVGMTVFEVKETNRRTYDYLVVHGLDVIKSVAQGADLPVASTDQGHTATWTQSRYGKNVWTQLTAVLKCSLKIMENLNVCRC